jgi:hypothetical protein
VSAIWPWTAVAGLGAFHGLNPAMGWLFAVALGLHRGRRDVVLAALPALALGHAASVALVAGLFAVAGVVVGGHGLYAAAGLLLLGWALVGQTLCRRRRVRIGLRTGLIGLTLWSFVMSGAHGAGLMLAPALTPLCGDRAPVHAVEAALGAVAVHTGAMLAVTGVVALVVYERLGVAVLRGAWINFDLPWTVALAASGVLLLLMA